MLSLCRTVAGGDDVTSQEWVRGSRCSGFECSAFIRKGVVFPFKLGEGAVPDSAVSIPRQGL